MKNLSSRKRLLLFDVDGTLISTGGAGIASLQRRVRERFGRDDDLHEIEVAGKTDINIIRDILTKYGEPATTANIESFAREYLTGLPAELARSAGRVLPGVTELLAHAAEQPHLVLALLTGNLAQGAQLKLQHFNLWQYFEFGAFADDHHDRNELGAFARQRAQSKHGHEFDGASIDVIGDTGHDVACGEAIGARTIAVATGGWSAARLQSCRPDFFFADFANFTGVIRKLEW